MIDSESFYGKYLGIITRTFTICLVKSEFAYSIIIFHCQFCFPLKGVELSERERFVQFEVATSDKGCTVQELVVKQIILGDNAKQGEYNVVQVSV